MLRSNDAHIKDISSEETEFKSVFDSELKIISNAKNETNKLSDKLTSTLKENVKAKKNLDDLNLKTSHTAQTGDIIQEYKTRVFERTLHSKDRVIQDLEA